MTESVLAAAFCVSISDLRKPSRNYAKAAFTRQIAFYLLHVGFGLDFSTIGRAMGRNRTTIQHACARIEDARDKKAFDQGLEYLERALIALYHSLEHTQKEHDFGVSLLEAQPREQGTNVNEEKYNFQSKTYPSNFHQSCIAYSTFSAPLR
jgi:hypothetical protein